MHLAANRLTHTSDTVEVIAFKIGYTSGHAFNRAFARSRGHLRGRYRQPVRPPLSSRGGPAERGAQRVASGGLDFEQEPVLRVGRPEVAVGGCEAEGGAGQLELPDGCAAVRVHAAEEVADAGAVPERVVVECE